MILKNGTKTGVVFFEWFRKASSKIYAYEIPDPQQNAR